MNLLFVLLVMAGVGWQAQAAQQLGRGGKCALVFKTIARGGPFAAYRVYKHFDGHYSPRQVELPVHEEKYQKKIQQLSESVSQDLRKLNAEQLSDRLKSIIETKGSLRNLELVQDLLLYRTTPLPNVLLLWSPFMTRMIGFKRVIKFEILDNSNLDLQLSPAHLDHAITTTLREVVDQAPPDLAEEYLAQLAIAQIRFAARGTLSYPDLIANLQDLAKRPHWTELALLWSVSEFWMTIQETFLHPELHRPTDRQAARILEVFRSIEKPIKAAGLRDVDPKIRHMTNNVRALLGIENLRLPPRRR